MKTYWVSCNKFTIFVEVKNNIIIDTAPVTKKFIGQNINNLIKWFKKFKGFKIQEI